MAESDAAPQAMRGVEGKSVDAGGGAGSGQATDIAITSWCGSVHGTGIEPTGWQRRRWQWTEHSVEATEGWLEAGREGHKRSQVAPLRLPQWWRQRLCQGRNSA